MGRYISKKSFFKGGGGEEGNNLVRFFVELFYIGRLMIRHAKRNEKISLMHFPVI